MTHAARFLVLGICLTLPLAARAQPGGQRVQFGQDILIEAGETVSEAVCFGCSITIRGTVSGNLAAFAGRIDIDGPVAGNVASFGGSIRLGPNAEVAGNIASFGGKIERDSQAKVAGEVTAMPGWPTAGAGLAVFLLVGLVVCAAIHLVLVLLSYLIAGQHRVETIASTVRERAGLALLAGLGVLVASVILFIISALLGPLTPVLAILVALGLFVTLILGYTGLSSWMGRSLMRTAGPLAAVLVGAILITILQLIPLLGILLFIAFFLLALGSAAVSGFGTDTNWLPQQLAGRPAVPPGPPAGLR